MYAMYPISCSDKKCKAEHSIVNNRNKYTISNHISQYWIKKIGKIWKKNRETWKKSKFIMAQIIVEIWIQNWKYFWEKSRFNIERNLGSKWEKSGLNFSIVKIRIQIHKYCRWKTEQQFIHMLLNVHQINANKVS